MVQGKASKKVRSVVFGARKIDISNYIWYIKYDLLKCTVRPLEKTFGDKLFKFFKIRLQKKDQK